MSINIKEGQTVHGFELKKRTTIKLPKIRLFEFVHADTQTQHLHIEADDENNCFAVAFRTVPHDSTGVAHILEHIVLCGSKNYTVRDPFFSMLRRSMNTFMNAFTAQDWTMYPFATCNKTDFTNLLRVYLDAAFFPLLKEESFMQEGHYLTFRDDDYKTSPLAISGVVFNEMKGAMASQADMMFRKTTEAVYPTITYHHNSGGEPLTIPTLGHDALKAFHKEHYHPSNAMFFTYGDMAPEPHLKIINEHVLSQFDARRAGAKIPVETRYTKPKQFEYPYAYSGDAKDIDHSFQTALAWMTNPIASVQETVSMELMEEMILGNSAAALKKALLESKLGKSLSDVSGYHGELSETCFAAGLQGVHKNHVQDVCQLVIDTLTDIKNNGIDKRQVESVIHNFELENREGNKGSFPRGLEYILRTYPFWCNRANPADILDFERVTENLKANLNKDKFYFESLIEKNLLTNLHRVQITLFPDTDFNQKQERQISEYLQNIEMRMSEGDRAGIAEKVLNFEESRQKEENVDSLPFLPLSEIRVEKSYANPTAILENPEIYQYKADTNGIVYYRLLFCLPELTEIERPLLPLFTYLFNKSGTENYTYDDLSLELNLSTGGVGCDVEIQDSLTSPNHYYDYIEFGGKALYKNADRMMALSEELLHRFTFKDTARVKNLLSQRFVGMVNSIGASGHIFALMAANRNLTRASSVHETYQGLEQIKQSAAYENYNTDEFSDLLERLANLGKKIFSSDTARAFVCCEEDVLGNMTDKLSTFIESLSGSSHCEKIKTADHKKSELLNESQLFQSPVSYVAKSIPTVNFLHEDSPYLFAAANFIQSEYIHPEIREKGGAYGGKCLYDHITGLFSFLSYRDPQYKQTLDVYDNTVRWFKKKGMTKTQLEESVLASFRKLDMPHSNVQKSSQDFNRRFFDQTRESVDIFRNRLITVKTDDIARVVEKYLNRPGSCVTLTSDDLYAKDFGSATDAPKKIPILP